MSEAFRFGDFLFDAERVELRSAGIPLKVEPRPLEVLAELLRHAGELVTKAELMDTVWAGRVVSESVITRCINRLRLALGDADQSLILTIHGFGYRFTGPVERERTQEDTPPARALTLLRAGEAPPMRPGWRLERPLHEGRIWLARNESTGEQRVLKYGFDPPQLAALRREVLIHRVLYQGLGARSDIARLLDQNLVSIPFFIELEYCPEGSLAHWFEAHGGAQRIPLAQRVDLIAQAAEAIAAAHSLGVLHLDIKPSNLLVWTDHEGNTRIRWSDFGSGRLCDPRRLADLGVTRADLTRTVVAGADPLQGTLNYIAPELLRGETPTVAADIYALGVMLYQLIVGDLRRPVAAGWEQNVPDELLRADVAAAAHDTPQARLSSAGELCARLRSLDRRRAQVEEEARRVRDQAALQMRLDRARARRPWIIAAMVALVIGLGVSLRNYRAAAKARDEARVQASIADAVVSFLDQDILSEGSPFSVADSGAGRLTVRDAVDRAAAKLDGRFPGQPRIEAAIRATIGQVYVEDGDYAAAETQVGRAVALSRTSGSGVDERTLQAEYGLAFALSVDQKFGEARELIDAANHGVDALANPSPQTLLRREVINGNYWLARQDFRRAAPFFERALAQVLQNDAGDVSHLVIRQTSLAWCYSAMGQYARAEPLYTAALRAVRAAEATPGTLTGTVEERFGIGLFLAGRDREAKPMLESAYAHLESAIGDDGLTAEALTYLGWLNLRQGAAVAALAQLQRAYGDEFASSGKDHRMTLRALACLGLAEIAVRQTESGMATLKEAVLAYQQVLGGQAPEAQLFLYYLMDAALSARQPLPVAADQANTLSADLLSQAAPWENWDERIKSLKGSLAALHPRSL